MNIGITAGVSNPYPGGLDHPTMLTRAEIDHLHDVAASLHGVGRIVEIGCFLGGSTRAVLRAVDLNPSIELPIISHDRFIIERGSQVGFLQHLPFGASFRGVYDRLMHPWSDRVIVREGTLPFDAAASSRDHLYPEQSPIELLFLDFAGHPGLHRTALSVWGTHLVPGAGVLFEQDMQYARLHWIALHASLLRESLSPIAAVADSGSCVFRVTAPLSPLLEGLPRIEEMPADGVVRLWADARRYFHEIGWEGVADTVPLYLVNHLASNGWLDAAADVLGAMIRGDEPTALYGLRPTLADLGERITAADLAAPARDRLLTNIEQMLSRGHRAIADREVARQTARADWLRDRLWDRVSCELQRLGVSEIALFGAGAHTRDLLASGWPRRGGVEVACLLDDHPAGAQAHGVPVIPPGALPDHIRVVIISSDVHEVALYRRAIATLGHRCIVITPYGADGSIEGARDGEVHVRQCQRRRA